MKRFYLTLLMASLFSIPLTAEKIKVVTTFLPIYAHTKSIAGDLAEVSSLVGGGSDPHDFQFKPSDMKRLAEANVIVMNGVGIEEWMEKPLSKFSNSKKTIIDTSKGVDLLNNPEVIELTAAHEGHDHKEGEHHHDHESGKNPHIWLDPVIAKQQVKNILEGLIQADPSNKSGYQSNAEKYLEQLEKLNQDFQTQVQTLSNKNLITFHDAFPYLAKRYGFKYIGAVEDFPEKSPSPKVLKEMVDLIRKHKVTTVFVEEGYSQKSLQSIARESGAKISTLDTLEVGTTEADAYLKRMRNNLEALKSAWK